MWIDSICIDQTSTDERNQQVALMGEIYGRAMGVNIWLGESDEQTDACIRWIEEVTAVPGTESETAVQQKLNRKSS
jgi:hypothetical protein